MLRHGSGWGSPLLSTPKSCPRGTVLLVQACQPRDAPLAATFSYRVASTSLQATVCHGVCACPVPAAFASQRSAPRPERHQAAPSTQGGAGPERPSRQPWRAPRRPASRRPTRPAPSRGAWARRPRPSRPAPRRNTRPVGAARAGPGPAQRPSSRRPIRARGAPLGPRGARGRPLHGPGVRPPRNEAAGGAHQAAGARGPAGCAEESAAVAAVGARARGRQAAARSSAAAPCFAPRPGSKVRAAGWDPGPRQAPREEVRALSRAAASNTRRPAPAPACPRTRVVPGRVAVPRAPGPLCRPDTKAGGGLWLWLG